MPNSRSRRSAVSLLGPPYSRLHEVDLADPIQPHGGGWIMALDLEADGWSEATDFVASRLAGVALAIILPDSDERAPLVPILRAVQKTRPQAVVPHHETLRPHEIAQVIRRPPVALAQSVTDYMAWRGFSVDPTTRNIIQRIVELSARLSTITDLARSLYVSRRALGRRLLNSGLPVPSHWLHIARLIRATIKLQNSTESLFKVATSLGYPDGFSMSNQMHRLCGIRPQHTRERYGWEWVFESWLVREMAIGGVTSKVVGSRPSIAETVVEPTVSSRRRATRAVANAR